MMKKILLVSLIATTGLIGVHKMNQPTTGFEADLVVTNYWVTGDDAPMDYENGYSAKVGMGNQANFAVPDLTTEEGLDFGISFVNGYYCDGACVGSENKVVVRGSETDVANYYTDGTENLVCVIDTNNKLVGMAGIADGETIDSTKIDSFKGSLTAPAGYTIDTNLYYDDGTVFEAGVTEVNDNMILKSKLTYNDSYKTFAVDVTSEDGTATATNEEDESGATVDVKFDKMVTLTSTNENFSYWTVNDTIVSYESTYTFSVYSDVSVVEVVGETEFTAAPVINSYTTDDSDTDMDNLFVCGFSLLPEGNTLVEAGMLFGGTTFEDATSKVVANTISENNEFAVKYDGDDKDTNVAYLVYKDSLGAISTVYSAVVADEPAEPVTISLNKDNLGLGAYGDGTATVDTVGFEYHYLGSFDGSSIQMNKKNPYIRNTSAFANSIDYIEITLKSGSASFTSSDFKVILGTSKVTDNSVSGENVVSVPAGNSSAPILVDVDEAKGYNYISFYKSSNSGSRNIASINVVTK